MKVIEMRKAILAAVVVLGLCGLAVGGSALEFDGVDDYVALPDNNPIWVPEYNFSLSAWVYCETIPAPEDFPAAILDLEFANGGGLSGSTGCGMLVNKGSGEIILRMTTAANIDDDLFSNTGLLTGRWYHIVAVRHATTQAIYIDGQLDNSRTCTGDAIKYVGDYGDDNVQIGRATKAGFDGQYLDGSIDEVGIYNRALDANEIADIYHCGVFDDANLVGYWGFEEGAGQVAYDNSAYGNDGYLGSDANNADSSDPVWVASEVPGVTYHVDVVSGDNGNDGLTKETAFAAIQMGIDSAEDCDTVLVWPGVYNESLFFINKGITVQSAADAAEIVASGIYGASLYTSEGPDSILKNFVIRDSDTGVYVSSGAPWLEHLTVVNCDLGVEAEAGAEPNIVNSILWNNAYDLFQCEAQYSWVEEQMDANLVAYWRFEEGSGTTAYDWVGDNDGTITGATWTTGKVGGALEFDGSNDYVEAPELTGLNSDYLTMFCWIYPTGAPSATYGTIIFSGDNTGGNDVHLAIKADLALHCRADGAATGGQFSSSSNAIQLNKWQHVGCVFDNTSDKVYGYIDGETVIDATYSTYVPSDRLAYTEIGRMSEGGASPLNNKWFFGGKIDEVGIWDRALSAAEVKQLYENGLAGHEYIDPVFADAEGGDYHLKSERGRYWPEHDVWVLDEVSSPCIDAGDARVQPTGEPAANGGRINMGAYGNTAYASMSEWGLEADFDYDGAVGLDDVGSFTDEWLETVTYSQKSGGTALEFDGTDDWVTIPQDASMNFSRSFSISAWLKPVANPSDLMNWFLHLDSKTNGKMLHLRTYPDGKIRFAYWGDDLDTNPGTMSFGSWNHVVATYDYNLDVSTIYVDGLANVSGDAGPYTGSNVASYIGKEDNVQYFDGKIDEVGIWDRALSASEIEDIYHCGVVADSNLVGYWGFEEGAGQVAADGSGNGNDGQLGSSAGADSSDPVWVESEVPGVTYHVDGAGGNNGNDGLTKETAFRTIQFGIDTAEGCDRVLVWPGVYNESLFFIDKGITVRSAADAAKLTATGLYAASFYNFGGADATLSNFVITDSDTGIYAGSGQPELTNLTVVGNWLGVEAEAAADPNINSCIFWDNDYDLFQCTATYSLVEEEISVPVAYWKFDEGSGATANDSVGGNDGTIYGATTTTGQVDGALDFDGMNDYVEVADDPSLRFSQSDSFSIAMWAKPLSAGYLLSKMRKGGQAAFFGYQIVWQEANSRFLFMIESSYRGTTNLYTSDNSAPVGSWRHLTCVYDNKAMKVYLDGGLHDSGTFSYNTGSSTPDKALSIGARSYDSTIEGYFEGSIDEVTIWDTALSAAEIGQLYQSGAEGRGLALEPLFADANGGDYHLLSERGRYWPGQDVWVLDDVTSPCVDGGDPAVAPSAEPMPNGARVNMGAYGATAYASMSEWPIAGDMDEDGIVNMVDYAILADEWLSALPWAQ